VGEYSATSTMLADVQKQGHEACFSSDGLSPEECIDTDSFLSGRWSTLVFDAGQWKYFEAQKDEGVDVAQRSSLQSLRQARKFSQLFGSPGRSCHIPIPLLIKWWNKRREDWY
jgi:hypothetical protein